MTSLVACIDCGHRRPAIEQAGSTEPLLEECPKCGTTRFEPVDGEGPAGDE